SREGYWCVYMETLQAYLDRKHEEISLLNGCLRPPLALPPANSVPAIVRQKFQLAAALKAQHALDHWASTETAWAEKKDFCSGPFFSLRLSARRPDRVGSADLCGPRRTATDGVAANHLRELGHGCDRGHAFRARAPAHARCNGRAPRLLRRNLGTDRRPCP